MDRIRNAPGNGAAQPVKCRPMKPELWTPHVTVSALVERAGRFLLIEEKTSSGLRINQPAGHLEAGETLVDAVIRETLEETAYPFTPDALLGVYVAHYARPGRAGATYLRFAFCGTVGEPLAGHALDDGIVRTLWMTADELRACVDRHRSPSVMRCVDDYLAGRRIPLDFVHIHSVAPNPDAFLAQAQANGK
jgi:8-oxo-dGTP pyrophosphatase MutT (NUDIX family)